MPGSNPLIDKLLEPEWGMNRSVLVQARPLMVQVPAAPAGVYITRSNRSAWSGIGESFTPTAPE